MANLVNFPTKILLNRYIIYWVIFRDLPEVWRINTQRECIHVIISTSLTVSTQIRMRSIYKGKCVKKFKIQENSKVKLCLLMSDK